MFKSKLLTFVGASILAGSSWAGQEIPATCPNIVSIQTEGLAFSLEIIEGMYFTYNSNHYDTNSNWVFILGLVKAESNEIALNEGNQVLSNQIKGTPYPQQDSDGFWFCQYQTNNQDLMAYAIQADEMISPLKMARYLRTAYY